MMLVRMKLRNTSAIEWRDKWLRARRRIRGTIKIMAIVKSERLDRIKCMYSDHDEAET